MGYFISTLVNYFQIKNIIFYSTTGAQWKQYAYCNLLPNTGRFYQITLFFEPNNLCFAIIARYIVDEVVSTFTEDRNWNQSFCQ